MQRLRCLNLAAAAKKFSNAGGTLITLGATSVEYGTRETSDPILVDWTGLGNAMGPMIAAALVLKFGYRTSFVAIGAAVALCGVVFMLAMRRQPRAVLAAAT